MLKTYSRGHLSAFSVQHEWRLRHFSHFSNSAHSPPRHRTISGSSKDPAADGQATDCVYRRSRRGCSLGQPGNRLVLGKMTTGIAVCRPRSCQRTELSTVYSWSVLPRSTDLPDPSLKSLSTNSSPATLSRRGYSRHCTVKWSQTVEGRSIHEP